MLDIQSLKPVLQKIYSEENLQIQFDRYNRLVKLYQDVFSESELHFFSTPGRTEIGGNHTDHNHGRVLAGSVNLDTIGVAAKNNSAKIRMYSQGYQEAFSVDLSELDVKETEKCSTNALIRGIAARFKQLGNNIGGFNAYITSDVLPGSGLSSSASIEVLIGTIFNALFNNEILKAEELAIIGQYAENEYFGKPCGLMDQMAIAVGNIITIDFKNPEKPKVKKVDFDFNIQNYKLLVVDTRGDHLDLTDDYAAIPAEMKLVAASLGKKVCREIQMDEFVSAIDKLRRENGDRAVLRALHFLQENERVVEQVNSLENGNFELFLKLVKESGDSSFKWLQNIYSTKSVTQQDMTLALALTEKYLKDIGKGACRVHGGGFAGTIQVFIPDNGVQKYIELMESVFGKNCVKVLRIRPQGAVYLNSLV